LVIHGTAKNVPWVRFASRFVVFAQSIDGCIVAVVQPEHYTILDGHNLAGEARDSVQFNGEEVIGCPYRVVDETSIFNRLQYTGALTRTVLMAGALERIFELTVAYVNERQQFGRPISRFQAIQQQIAILAGEVAAAGIAVEYAIEAFNIGNDPTETMIAKIRVGQAASKVAPMAHQIHGAIGFTDEHILLTNKSININVAVCVLLRIH
jgi:acyl-CoA dehydrogenase